MIVIPIENGQLTQPQPENYIAIINNGNEAKFYFSVDELPEELQPIVNPDESLTPE